MCHTYNDIECSPKYTNNDMRGSFLKTLRIYKFPIWRILNSKCSTPLPALTRQTLNTVDQMS